MHLRINIICVYYITFRKEIPVIFEKELPRTTPEKYVSNTAAVAEKNVGNYN
jgi:hypothetical protein